GSIIPFHEELDSCFPGLALIFGGARSPVEGIWRNISEHPLAKRSLFVAVFLDDFVSNPPAYHAVVRQCHRVDPGDVPNIFLWIVNSQRRAVAITFRRKLCCSPLGNGRHDKYILNGAAFEHPAKVPFATRFT